MTDLIDLSLLKESRSLLEAMLVKRGLPYFLGTDGGRPLFSIDGDKVETLVQSCVSKLARKGRTVHPRSLEHCRKELRRELIRRVTQAMLRVGY